MKIINQSLFVLTLIVFASHGASAASASQQDAEKESYGFLEVGVSAQAFTPMFLSSDSYIRESRIDVRGAYYWANGMFLEGGSFGSRGNGIGYTFYDNDDWEIAALLHISHGGVLTSQFEISADLRFGLRATKYFDDSLVRVILSPTSLEIADSSFFAAAWYGKTWQVQNWSLFAIAGASYYSDAIVNRYYGVRRFSENQFIEPYTAGSGFMVEAEFGGSYAFTENWVVDLSIGQSFVSSAISDSPVVDNAGQTFANLGFYYVF